jgi:hypothetical protein
MSSKPAFEKKVDGKIKEEKPLATTPGSDRGGKFYCTHFS